MFAVISDIHANFEALQAVFADIDEQNVSEIFCLGDVIGYGPSPRECIDLAMERCEFFICGNHDHAVMYEPYGFHHAAEKAAYWTRSSLEDEPSAKKRNLRWDLLANMRFRATRDDFQFVHASPRKPLNEYIFMDDVFVDVEKIAGNFDAVERKVCFIGHTHTAGVFLNDPPYHDRPEELPEPYVFVNRGGKAIVNVGSVGQPRDRDPRASYVVVDGDRITWRRIEYDRATTVEKIMKNPALENYLGERLYDGR